MRLLYQLGVEAYVALVRLIAPFNHKASLWVDGRKNPSERIEPLGHYEGALWMHCASVGEFEQGRPVFEALKQRYPEKKAIVSFFSPSGFEARKNWPGADLVFYLPVDRKRTMRALVTRLKPSAVVWVKYEFWFNALAELHRQHIPVFLVSGVFRPSQHFFQFWGGWFSRQLHHFSLCFVQDVNSRDLLRSVGVDADVVGDTRFDRVLQIAKEPFNDALIEAFAASGLTLVAGSTWPADEVILAEAVLNSNWKLVLVPHEITDEHLRQIDERFPSAVWYSKASVELASSANVLVIDCMGMLSKLYRFGQAAYVGGGFGAGIHNTAEAAVYGIPVVFGKRFQKFNEAIQLIASKGGYSINEASALRALLTGWEQNPAQREASGREAKKLIEQGSGATLTIVTAIAACIEN
ncbi:MAG: 3-deoxy-D-manno-octulosonic acid transferase [Flavobacteriales bacterium]